MGIARGEALITPIAMGKAHGAEVCSLRECV